MKKRLLAMLLSALLVGNISGCSYVTGNDTDMNTGETETTQDKVPDEGKTNVKRCVGIKDLVFASNGNGTCTLVGIKDPSHGKDWLIVQIPDRSSDGEEVTCISANAFIECRSNLLSVSMTDSILEIDARAFADCTALEEARLSSSLTEIKEGTFDMCGNLKSIQLPSNISSIGERAFRQCANLSSVKLPEAVSYVGESAFEGTTLTCIVFPDEVKEIGSYALAKCKNLQSVVLPSTLETVERGIFNGCTALTDVTVRGETYRIKDNCLIDTKSKTLIAVWGSFTLPNDGSIQKIGPQAFGACPNITEIALPQSVTEIDSFAFSYLKQLNSISLSPNILKIGSYAFSHCQQLSFISIPKGVKKLEKSVFSHCEALERVNLPNSLHEVDENTFQYLSNAVIHYEGSSEEWNDLAEHLELVLIEVRCNDGKTFYYDAPGK